MRVRKIDDNNDWCFGYGRASFLGESKAIAQCVKTKLLSLKNDWFLNLDDGIAWFDYLKKNPNLSQLESDIKVAVFSIEGVTEITEFDVLLDTDTRKFLIQISYKDKFNETSEVSFNVASDR